MKGYFESCQTLDEAKALYKKLAMQLHPDLSGYDSKADFQEMQSQFESFRPQREKFKGEQENWNAADFKDIINELMKIRNIEFEICGSFIWLSGETKANKEEIKAIKNEAFKPAQWHSKKLMWFFAPVDYRRFSGKNFEMDDIRKKYGSEKYQAEREKQVQAA